MPLRRKRHGRTHRIVVARPHDDLTRTRSKQLRAMTGTLIDRPTLLPKRSRSRYTCEDRIEQTCPPSNRQAFEVGLIPERAPDRTTSRPTIDHLDPPDLAIDPG
jgi:hypothetical protein